MVRLEDAQLESVVTELWAVRRSLASMKKLEEGLAKAVKDRISRVRDDFPKGSEFELGGYRVSFTNGSSSRIDREMLLAQGVDPEKIGKATRVSSYEKLLVDES